MQENAEIMELLLGIRDRFDMLGIPPPLGVVVDNCCQVRNCVEQVFPLAGVFLDIFHCVMR